MRRTIVAALATADAVVDAIAYRPLVVRAFRWLPRWWRCDLARLSVALDDRWGCGYWDVIVPSGLCDACGRRAAIHLCGGDADEDDGADDFLAHRPVHTCGWCRLDGPITDEAALTVALAAAGRRSVSWRWRAC